MPAADTATIGRVLRDIAAALTLKGESRFRITAYERGADAIAAFVGDLDTWIRQGRLSEIQGVGDKLAALIAEVRNTGTAKALETLKGELPPGALALSRGASLTLKAIETLSAADIRTVEALREAAEGGRLRTLSGFTVKTEERILKSLRETETRQGRLILGEAQRLAEDLMTFLMGSSRETLTGRGPVKQDDSDERPTLDVVGAVRRGVEVIEVTELLATSPDPQRWLRAFERYPGIATSEARSDTMREVRLTNGHRVRLHAFPPSARASARQRLTGSSTHNAAFDDAAKRAHLVVEAAGAYLLKGKTRTPFDAQDEEALYSRASLRYIPAPMREGDGEVEAAAQGRLPTLVTVGDIRGMVHCHTVHSDGKHTIEEMARAAQDRGMKYITITDHSPTAHYAHGVELDRLKRQWDDIARAQELLSIRILRGTESDILKDGSLDYPDAILEQFDIIVASIHNRYGLDEAAMTERIVRAMRHPLFKVWGHALGRLLLQREPIACDIEAILDAAAESRVAIEINGDPHRLDLEPRFAKMARERKLRFTVSVDAHAMRELDNVALGVLMAQRAGLTKDDVLNTLDPEAFLAAVKPASAPPAAPGDRQKRAKAPANG